MIDIVVQYYPLLLEGLWLTVKLLIASTLASVPLALLIAMAHTSRKRWARRAAVIYTEIFRSIPVLVLLVGLYYGLGPYVVQWGVTAFAISVLALTLNESAYLAEYYRGVLYAIPFGQWNAAASLGLTKWQTLSYVIFPQFLPASMPHLTNAVIYLLKSSALASLITLQELMAMGNRIVFQTFDALPVYAVILVLYLALAGIVAYISRHVEKRLIGKRKRLTPAKEELEDIEATLGAKA